MSGFQGLGFQGFRFAGLGFQAVGFRVWGVGFGFEVPMGALPLGVCALKGAGGKGAAVPCLSYTWEP